MCAPCPSIATGCWRIGAMSSPQQVSKNGIALNIGGAGATSVSLYVYACNIHLHCYNGSFLSTGCTRHNVRIFHIHIGFTNHDKPMSVLNWHYVAVENTSNWYIKDSYTHTMTIVASTFRYKVDIIMTKKYQRLVYIKLTSNRCRIDIKRLLFNTSV